jgi:hypothetical protein
VRSLVVTGLAVALTLSLPLGAADAARDKGRSPARQRARTRTAAAPRLQPTMTRAEANRFLRSPAGKTKIRQYKDEALHAPRYVGDYHAEKGFGSLREQRDFYKSRGRILKIFSYASSAVTGLMGGMLGGVVGMWTGGMPSGPEMMQQGVHPAMHFISQGHVVIGALIGAGAAIAAGTAVSFRYKRMAREVEGQAEAEAELRLWNELGAGGFLDD